MVLAAGRGERLRPITESIPKPLVQVRGKPLIDHHLERLARAGITSVVMNLGWLGDQLLAHVASGERYGLNVVYSPEGENILETGGGIHRALPMLGPQPFAAINADIYTDMPIPDVSFQEDELAHLVLVPTPDYRAQGDFDLLDGKVRNAERPALTYSGVAIYRPEFFADCTPGRFSLVPLLQAAADQGCLSGSLYEGTWADIGTPERLAAVNDDS